MAHRRLPLAGLLAVILLLTACKRDEPAQPGGLPEGVFDSLARPLPSNRPAVTFTEFAQQSGITFVHSRGERSSMLPEDMGSGAAWGTTTTTATSTSTSPTMARVFSITTIATGRSPT